MMTVSRLEDTGNEWCRNEKNMESLIIAQLNKILAGGRNTDGISF